MVNHKGKTLLFRNLRLIGRSHRRETQNNPTSKRVQSSTANENVVLAFIGSIVPDEPAFHTSAFSRAGNMCQQNLLRSLINAGLHPSIILSYRPEPSFPTGRRIWLGKEQISLSEGMRVNLLPFINITPFKQIIIGQPGQGIGIYMLEFPFVFIIDFRSLGDLLNLSIRGNRAADKQ